MLNFNKVGDKSWLGRLQSLKVLIDWYDASAEARVETVHIKISFRDLRMFSVHCCGFFRFLKSSHGFGKDLSCSKLLTSELSWETLSDVLVCLKFCMY